MQFASTLTSFLSPASLEAPKSPTETIIKISERCMHAAQLEDRRAAVLTLKGLARDYKKEVGMRALDPLSSVLKHDRPDLEIIKAVMETLNTLCTKDSPNPTVEDLGIQFTDAFIKHAENVTLLLGLLEETEFYIRWNTVQLLTVLLDNKPKQLQSSIMTSPLGVSRLIDLLEDEREVIRNDGLLLLIHLTQDNADIQKIIAFENTFERLLVIIQDLGSTDGGVIVQDCLQLMHNMLKYNVSNQNYFREAGLIQRLPNLLNNINPEVWSGEKINNVSMMCDLFRVLVPPSASNTPATQGVINSGGVTALLLDLGLHDAPPPVKADALYATADLIRDYTPGGDLFASKVIDTESGMPQNAIQRVMDIAMGSAVTWVDWRLRFAASYCVQCYLCDNPEAQNYVLRTTLANSPLLKALLGWDHSMAPLRSWSASLIFIHLFLDNDGCKELVGAAQVRETSDDQPVNLLTAMFTYAMSESSRGGDARNVLGLLCIISMVLHGSRKNVSRVAHDGVNVQFLVELISQSSSDQMIQGVAAFLLGICYEFNDDSEPNMTRAKLLPIITGRIGIDVFVSRINRLRENDWMKGSGLQEVTESTMSKETGLPNIFFDAAFIDCFKSNSDGLIRLVQTHPSKIKPTKLDSERNTTETHNYKEVISTKDNEIKKLQDQLSEMKLQQSVPVSPVKQIPPESRELQSRILELETALSSSQAQVTSMQSELDDLLVCLAEQDEKCTGYRKRLRGLGEQVTDDEDDDDDVDKTGETQRIPITGEEENQDISLL